MCKNPNPDERPCPYVSCRWHMFDIIKGDKRYSDDELADIALGLPQTCFWDVWYRGCNYTPEEIGTMFRFTGNMVSNIVRETLKKPTVTRGHLRVVYEKFYDADYDDT